jgi:transcription elongation factor Elf1
LSLVGCSHSSKINLIYFFGFIVLDQAVDVYNKWCAAIIGDSKSNRNNKGEEEDDDDDNRSDIDLDDLEENEFYH